MSTCRTTVGRAAGRTVMMAMLASLAVPVQVMAQPPAISEADAHAYADLLTVYRGNEIERAVEGLARLLAASEGQRQVSRHANRHARGFAAGLSLGPTCPLLSP